MDSDSSELPGMLAHSENPGPEPSGRRGTTAAEPRAPGQSETDWPRNSRAGSGVAGAGRATTDDESTASMHDSLEKLVLLIERVAPGMRGSVLLLDDDGVTLRHGAAPSLPAAYMQLIDGERIGPVAGSCGTAAYRRERVIVRDISTDPLWANYRQAAEPYGLAASWSTPILNPTGQVLGTFAMYYGEPRAPTAADIGLTETAAVLAANIISRARAVSALRVREEQLRSSQEQLRTALDASETSTWLWDMQTNVVEGDESLFRLFGVDPEAAASGSFELLVSLIHADDRERVKAATLLSATEGVDLDEEFRIVRPDGTVRWIVDKGRVLFDADGKPRNLVGACVDVTDQRVRDAQFRALAESIPQLAWTADASGWIDWYNQRWYEYTGTTLEEMQGWGWRKVHHPDHVDRVVARIQQSWDSGVPWDDTFPLRGKDGRYRWFLSRAQPIRDADGNVLRWFGTNTDITELREAEVARDLALAEAKAERKRLYEVFMQAPAAITVLEGPEHVCTVVNPLYLELVGSRDIAGKPVREALPELEGQGFFELLDVVQVSGKPYAENERLVRLDRNNDGIPEDLYVNFAYQPLKDGQGRMFGIMAHAVEVTEQVLARQEIDAARTDAERANRAKSEFLAAMSHDLRTPLNAIGGYADLIEEELYGPVTDPQRGALSRIRKSARHLLTLINDILSFARIEAGSLQLEIEEVSVNEVVSTAGAMVELQAADKGLSLKVLHGPETVRVVADRERTTRILANLLTNAVKFTDTGTITVDWQDDDGTVTIHVRDTGRGIPADRQAAIFQPFVQVGQGPGEERQGIGLGLAISWELARAMNGDLTVESVVAGGSTFTLTLPRADDA